jgi:uncharacterized protein YcfJ
LLSEPKKGEGEMKVFLGAAAILLSATLVPGAANAAGCIKGALVGGAAGHLVGPGKFGAAAGCVIGHHKANKAKINNEGSSQPAK